MMEVRFSMGGRIDGVDVEPHADNDFKPAFVLLERLATGERYELQAGQHVLGRCADSAIPFEDSLIARIHALLLVTPGSCVFCDMQPLNGSFINGAKIPWGGEVQLKVGDVVSLAGVEELSVLAFA